MERKGEKEMIEFTSSSPKKKNSFTFIITGAVLVAILGCIFAYLRYEGTNPTQPGESNVFVPDMLRPGNTDFEYYRTRIRIEDVKAVIQISFNNVRTAKISGTIVNDGDRKLDALELHITLFDVWGNVSKERTAFALRPKAGYSPDPMEPLERRRFTIGVESVEYYWDPKQITYEISGLRYQ
jgi:hypothetical protein